ncbi:phage Gp37/Gp68 family protein [Ancylobacter vacuolatus]|uniref:Protein gp37 n=1 Tax=Ancylobacter vacuolatus TaxID=223389 RepID=A0ABU0DMV2_9HYPH|nr:phage Gp37/Gp68 family protein [Ancylobacter vacuolatus]MDQ0349773.1 protein gp37 [Ancylobacter vacuolatus]
MADHTGIEWADSTWNPIVGCSIVSPGCTNCYAMKQAARIEAMQPGTHYAGTTQKTKSGAVWSGKLALAPDHILTQPLRWSRPRRIFVNSMSDLFHEDAPDAWIDQVFAVMAMAPQHTFMVLTKRSARMRAYVSEVRETWCSRGPPMPGAERIQEAAAALTGEDWRPETPGEWPLPNVWLGVSTEDQRRADERVPDLLATPAAVRFISAEPLLGPVNLFSLNERRGDRGTITDWHDSLRGLRFGPSEETAKLDLVISGGESGPKARPMHPDWARSLRDQCAAAGTAFFFKQWGEWEAAVDRERNDPDWRLDYSFKFADRAPHTWLNLAGGTGFHGERFHVMRRVGKRAAGRLLDGVMHNDMPEARL